MRNKEREKKKQNDNVYQCFSNKPWLINFVIVKENKNREWKKKEKKKENEKQRKGKQAKWEQKNIKTKNLY